MPDVGPVVVALGGNALLRPGEEGSVEQQFDNARETAVHLADLVEAGRQLVITHGNGPQVGHELRRVELAAHELYRLPLDICGANTQGALGYMIAQCLRNELVQRGVPRDVTAVVTSVEVRLDDPDFTNPTKPVGSFYPPDQAARLQTRYGWKMVEVPGRGMRRVVPSPMPQAIVEIGLITRLTAAGELLVCAGGGGIPVVRTPTGGYFGVEAVIDKDRTSGLLARAIDAAMFVIVTNVRRVAINYGKPNEQFLERMSLAEARRHFADKQFPPGSMGPKIEAAIDFLSGAARDDACVVICDMEALEEALAGRSGTRIDKGA